MLRQQLTAPLSAPKEFARYDDPQQASESYRLTGIRTVEMGAFRGDAWKALSLSTSQAGRSHVIGSLKPPLGKQSSISLNNLTQQYNNTMSILISVKVEVTKLDTSRFFKSESGAVYADLEISINEDADRKLDYSFRSTSHKRRMMSEAKQEKNLLLATVSFSSAGRPLSLP